MRDPHPGELPRVFVADRHVYIEWPHTLLRHGLKTCVIHYGVFDDQLGYGHPPEDAVELVPAERPAASA